MRAKMTAWGAVSVLAITAAMSGPVHADTAKAEAAGLDLKLYAAAVDAAKAIAGGAKLDPSIEYVGGNSGAEGAILEAVYQAFTDATGTVVQYSGTGASTVTAATVQSRVQAGNPPDLVDMSLGVAKGYAKAGKTLDLTKTIGADALAKTYSKTLLDSLSVDGKVFGVTQGFSTFMIWYNPLTYTGPNPPKTWKDVVAWTDASAAAGKTPWCNAQEAGGGSGFPGTQFIESLFAKMYGPDLLAQWADGTLPWTSPQVKSAWEAFGSIATDDKKVAGGVAGSLSTSMAVGSNGIIANPPTCQADLWGSWVPGLIGKGVEPLKNLDFFPIPGDEPKFASTEIVNAGSTVVLKDTPTTEAFIKYLASTPAQTLLASADHWTVANKEVPAGTYKSALLKKIAKAYFNDTVNLVAPPDIMSSAAVVAAFNKGVMTYLQTPSKLDDVLKSIQDAAQGT
jgi:alpha-glucoside transport system substrate-binding protein